MDRASASRGSAQRFIRACTALYIAAPPWRDVWLVYVRFFKAARFEAARRAVVDLPSCETSCGDDCCCCFSDLRSDACVYKFTENSVCCLYVLICCLHIKRSLN